MAVSRWRVEPAGKDLLRILGPHGNYLMEGMERTLTIRAVADEKVLEEQSIEHERDGYLIRLQDEQRRQLQLRVREQAGRIATDVELDGKTVRVEGRGCEHHARLVEQLLQRQRPHAARLRALGEAIRDDESLRREIEKGIQPRRFFVNGLDEGCAFFCLLASVQPEFLELCIYCMWAGGI